MLLLPASLLALATLQVSAIPIDQFTCDPDRLSLILNPSWATSPTIHSYCSALFGPGKASKPEIPSLEISSNATPTDVRKACECIVAMPQLPTYNAQSPQSQQQPQVQSQGKKQKAQKQQSQTSQKQQLKQQRLQLQPATEEQERRVRGGVVAGQAWQPYGRGALPAPVGSEFKGYGARDNLYVRGGVVDGLKDRNV